MKHSLSFLAGVALISLCVVATRSLPGYMFLIGWMASNLSIVILCRAIGYNRVARFFSYLDGIRLAPHWSSGAKRIRSLQARQVTNGDADGTAVIRSAKSRKDSGEPRSVNEASGRHVNPAADDTRQAGTPLAARGELPTRRNSRTARNAKSRGVVQSPETDMLSTTQQEVLSALINLGVSFGRAEEAVHAAAKEHGGESFDELFRVCLSLLNAGKSRRAA